MSTILDTIRGLSVFTGVVSLFFLGQTWFGFGLSKVFYHLHEFYAGLIHPVMEWLKPLALWLVSLFGWTLPEWWNDATVLYLAMGGAMVRTHRPLSLSGAVIGHPSWVGRSGPIQAPIRLLLWPLFWLTEIILELWYLRRLPYQLGSPFGEEEKEPERHLRLPLLLTFLSALRYGFVGESLLEFARILTGALIFAGLNAGLA